MTIHCSDCEKIPMSYVIIETKCLCLSCAKKLYELRLAQLKRQFAGVLNDEKGCVVENGRKIYC